VSVYVDPMMSCVQTPRWRWTEACHMFADSVDELHAFAADLGLRRAWFQSPGVNCSASALPHYDLTGAMRIRAIRMGAIVCTREQRAAWRERKHKQPGLTFGEWRARYGAEYGVVAQGLHDPVGVGGGAGVAYGGGPAPCPTPAEPKAEPTKLDTPGTLFGREGRYL
jgi:hypothetical protein